MICLIIIFVGGGLPLLFCLLCTFGHAIVLLDVLDLESVSHCEKYVINVTSVCIMSLSLPWIDSSGKSVLSRAPINYGANTQTASMADKGKTNSNTAWVIMPGTSRIIRLVVSKLQNKLKSLADNTLHALRRFGG